MAIVHWLEYLFFNLCGNTNRPIIAKTIVNISWILEKTSEFQKNIYFCFIDYPKVFDCVDHSRLWKILQEMAIPVHITLLLRNLYAGQEATGKTGHRTMAWFQIGKGVYQGCILSPCLFNYMQSTSCKMLTG